MLQHLRSKRDDFHEVLGAQLTNNWSKDTCTYGLVVGVQDDGGIAIKTDRGTIGTTDFFGGANDDGLTDITFLNATAGDGFLNRDNNDVAYGCVFTLGTTQNLDALNSASAGVVSNIQVCLHLDHVVSPDLWGSDACCYPPGFRQTGQFAAYGTLRSLKRSELPSVSFSISARIR
ncbi:hypothetical protein MED193_16674 [Roseobacter sp. MED193]|nr:hypothetical protein MED193_16674 [Roseobacter sp. MED193]